MEQYLRLLFKKFQQNTIKNTYFEWLIKLKNFKLFLEFIKIIITN